MLYRELQQEIHAQNVKVGWWDEPRPFHKQACLFHSELSEAMEGDRKNLMDDKLPHYLMFQVEIADYVIRVLDWLGSVYFDDWYLVTVTAVDSDDATEWLAELHRLVSAALVCNQITSRGYFLAQSVKLAYALSYHYGFDLDEIISEKREYNLHRADHKKENRVKEHGKAY